MVTAAFLCRDKPNLCFTQIGCKENRCEGEYFFLISALGIRCWMRHESTHAMIYNISCTHNEH